MRLKCILTKLDDERLHILGRNPVAKNHFHITLGKEYVALGVSFNFGDNGHGGFVQLLSDHNHLIDVPLELFEITDPRASKYWTLKCFSNGDIALWPHSFYQEYYHDDLSEDVPEIVDDFKRVLEEMTSEYA